MQFIYEAILDDADNDGRYSVELPDWGSATEGKGFEDAIRMGMDLLEVEITYALAFNRDIPQPVFGHKLSSGEERLLLSVKTSSEEAQRIWPWITTSEAAEKLGVTSGRIRQLVLDGLLGFEKNGRDLWVSRADVELRLAHPPRVGRPRRQPAPA